jgi:GMP synthase PP-ATPase subunit
MEALQGLRTRRKARITGELFIRISSSKLTSLACFLVQGTICPDVVESSAQTAHKQRDQNPPQRAGCLKICNSSWWNLCVTLFKDEVRLVGESSAYRDSGANLLGPGLPYAALGKSRSVWSSLRLADAIFTSELAAADLLLHSAG